MENKVNTTNMNTTKTKTNINIGSFLSKYGIYIVLAIMVIILSFISNTFFTTSNVLNILRQVSINGILAIGVTFVLITGGIDLSIGSVLALSGVVAASFAHPNPQYPLIFIIILSLVIGGVCGAINGALISFTNVSPFIVTLGMMTIARGAALLFTSGRPITGLSESFQFIGRGDIGLISVPVLVFIAISIITIIFLHKTKFGRYIFAIGGNEQAAKVSGINVTKIKFYVYIIAGCLTGLAGIILASRTNAAAPNAGVGYELDAIAAAVIGGTSTAGGKGAVYGTIVGALIMTVLGNGLDILNVSSYIQQIIKGIIIIGAVCIDQMNKSK